jgi:DNA polymerase delta subunit 1
MERVVYFKALYWGVEEVDNETRVHIGGLQRDNKSVHVIVKNFKPFVYLELPKKYDWNSDQIKMLISYFKNTMRENGPVSYSECNKTRLHYNEPVKCLKIYFPNQKATSYFAQKCHEARNGAFDKTNKGLYINGIGVFKARELLVHEQFIDPIVKLTAAKNISLASWISVKEQIDEGDYQEDGTPFDPEDRKFSTADIDLYADWNDVNPYDWKDNNGKVQIVPTNPKYMSFDIECYSKNHNSKIPDPTIPENVIFSLAYISGRFGKPHTEHRKVLLTLFNPKDIEGVEVIRCKNEKDLLISWTNLIQTEDPDIFLTYNGMKFDWSYIIKRSEILGIYPIVAEISRIYQQRADLKNVSWSSSAYGDQDFRYLEAKGRTNFDVLLEVERNFKLQKYSLDFVASHFLNEHKDDVTPRQLFMFYQLTFELLSELDEKCKSSPDCGYQKMSVETKKMYEDKIKKILISRFCTGEVRNVRDNLLKANSLHEMKEQVRECLTITGRYNVQDCILPIRIAEKLNLLITMEETSNITNVPVSYLHTRGQGIKVLSQIYRSTIPRNVIIPFHPRVNKEDFEKYQGAIVQEAHPGYYENVACLDFSSLYPSCMIALNICYTTFLRDDDPIPDEECTVLEFEDHIGCEHDPQHHKKKPEDVLCRKHRYRFRKMHILEDGSRVGEGIMPMIERNLLANRKIVKKEMERLECIYKVATGKADPEDIEEFRGNGIDIEAAQNLSQEEKELLYTSIRVLDAKQLAIKVAANSCYGILGSQGGQIPLIEGAASVTATGRILITEANRFITEKFAPAHVIYGDTDSTMVKFGDLGVLDSYNKGDKVSKEASHHLKCFLMKIDSDYHVGGYRLDAYPRKELNKLSKEEKLLVLKYDALPIKLEFENLYGKYFLLTKKRYVARVYNREGVTTKETKKGVVLARRDNCQYLRDSYKKLIDLIMENASEEDIKYEICQAVKRLYTRQIPVQHLIIYKGISTIINYAKKKEVARAGGDVVKVFIDEYGKPFEPYSPLDDRLVYSNLPQVLLALKILRRGEDVPPNTRLEYIFTENPTASHQGERAEDYGYFKENRHLYRIDNTYYIDSQLAKPFTELLNVKFKGGIISYIPLNEKFEILCEQLNQLQRSRVFSTKAYIKEVGKGYVFKNLEAQYTYILESMKRFNPETNINEIDPVKHEKLKNVCLMMKSFDVINKFGPYKRSLPKPPNTYQNIKVHTQKRGDTQIIFVRDYDDAKAEEFGILRNFVKKPNPNRVLKKDPEFLFFYDVYVPRLDRVIENVPRKLVTTFYHKDYKFMKEILDARNDYRKVVENLVDLFMNNGYRY